MIKNKRQYDATKKQIKELTNVLNASKTQEKMMLPEIYKAMVAGLESQLNDMEEEVKQYDQLKDAKAIELNSINELPGVLIKARIARGYTHKKLAKKANVTFQQIQLYEKNNYQSISMKNALNIAKALEVEIKGKMIL